MERCLHSPETVARTYLDAGQERPTLTPTNRLSCRPLKLCFMRRFLLPLLSLSALSAPASAASLWAGADATTTGYGVHAGIALLRVPFIGTLGVEGSAEQQWSSSQSRYAAGLTLRDVNLPLTRVDAFGTVGGELLSTNSTVVGYAEAGLRGPLLGPAGWRAFVRGNTGGQIGAGLGLELRF